MVEKDVEMGTVKDQEAKIGVKIVNEDDLKKLGEGRSLTKEQRKQLVDAVINRVEKVGKGFRSLSIKDTMGIVAFVPELVDSVEELGKKFKMAGAFKMNLAAEVANYFIDIPKIPEWLEGRLLKWLIEMALFQIKRLSRPKK